MNYQFSSIKHRLSRNIVFNPRKPKSFDIIIGSFAAIILLGTILLCLPISSADGNPTSPINALFTATSATCVTGLIVFDTASHWSIFGQAVILIMIQIGGMGVVTLAVSLMIIRGKKIGLASRNTVSVAFGAERPGGIIAMTKKVVRAIFIFELIGAILLSTVFVPKMGLASGLWASVFHSISAFCNAGFDIMGKGSPFSSLTAYVDNPLVNVVICLLIVIGGIGFFTWSDVHQYGFHFRKYHLQSKVILVMTAVLIVIPALIFFFADYANMPLKTRFLASIFQAITPRTAGFNTVDLNAITPISREIIIILMMIGGAPGSTAGGMKVTTVCILIVTACSPFQKRGGPHCFKRRLADTVVKQAVTLLILYVFLLIVGSMIISAVDGLPITKCIFETASAIGTVGLSLGITAQLSTLSKLILIGCMFIGRVGGLTLIYAALLGDTHNHNAKYPVGHIAVG